MFDSMGRCWKLLRKISHSALSMIGSGVQNLEEKSQREVDELFGFLSES